MTNITQKIGKLEVTWEGPYSLVEVSTLKSYKLTHLFAKGPTLETMAHQ